MENNKSILLFSYGTLQNEDVQYNIFKRRMSGFRDQLKGFKLGKIRLPDNSLGTFYPIISQGSPYDMVEGTVYEISQEELTLADDYEGDSYQKVKVQLESGKKAWVYCAK